MEHASDQTLRLVEAQIHYLERGYNLITVPWIVDRKYVDITLPVGANPVVIQTGECLVGSAEQSFLSLMAQNKLSPGKYQAVTPCFRDDAVDELHQRHFTKLELIDISGVDLVAELDSMILGSLKFFERYLSVVVVSTEEGFDIVDCDNKIELGSYGIRNHPMVGSWVYGTGLAEPRLDIVLKKQC